MSVKRTAQGQYQAIVDLARPAGDAMRTPPEGWVRTVRKALGMSGAQLARRMGVTRARIAQMERAELDGGVTLKSMQVAAEALGCKLVYALAPPASIENVIIDQARKKATAIIGVASKHMALENQALPNSANEQDIARLARELLHEMPADFWNDK